MALNSVAFWSQEQKEVLSAKGGGGPDKCRPIFHQESVLPKIDPLT